MKLILSLFFISYSLSLLSQNECDVIIKTNGDEIKAIVKEVGLEIIAFVKCENIDGPSYKLQREEIFMIRFKDGSNETFNNKSTSDPMGQPNSLELTKDKNSISHSKELGIDLMFAYSSSLYTTGTIGIGAKYGFPLLEGSVVLGPSLRYHRTWTNNPFNSNNSSTGFNIFGGGGFIHYRFANYFFTGAEIELLRSPYTNNGFLSNTSSKWVPTFLIGGGFSGLISESIRLNAGVMYDILDIPNPSNPSNSNPNSPLQPYIVRNKNTGIVVPIIYRIAFFIPIN